MSPQPEVSVNVQRYIGTSLISHQARGKKNICHSTPGRILHKEGQQNARGVCLDYQRPVCNCFSSNSDFSKHSHSKLNSCIWTGVPLINLSSRQIKNSVKPMYEIIGSRDLENGFIRAHELEESIFSMSPLRSNGYSYLNVNDILPMSKLAIHTRGSPLIISAERKDRTKPFSENLNISDGTLAEGKDFIPARRFQRPGDFCWTEDSHKRYVVSSSLLSSGTPIEHLQSGDETTSVSGESDVKSEPDYVRQSQQSDCISVTSEESSGTSEAFVPRIIKPRKRRRRDKKTAMIQNSLCSGSGILTLIPYQPLCYKYYERPKAHTRETHKKELCDSDTKESQSQFSDFHDSRMNLKLQDCSLLSSRSTHYRQDRYPYPPSPFCRCIYCVNSSSLMVSTIPKFDSSKPLIRKETVSSSTESMCEITARIVTSPCGSRDLEIKFIPIASSSYGDNESTAVECETFSTSSSEPSSPSCTSPLTQLHPPQRPWIPLALPDRQKPTCIFTVMCYNILCPKYATRQLYGYCPSWALSWEYRRKGIMEEIRHYSADIISLQLS
ncbi:uncharacterized protein LOC143229381 isoform X3 [Tachypleus tridentatus]|uniref:uncharacterized protein LOC143229381 isoform X3 n=1 Tax=Tachypleus tridentatus TaxID=6853 RepID=UPI003FD08CEF